MTFTIKIHIIPRAPTTFMRDKIIVMSLSTSWSKTLTTCMHKFMNYIVLVYIFNLKTIISDKLSTMYIILELTKKVTISDVNSCWKTIWYPSVYWFCHVYCFSDLFHRSKIALCSKYSQKIASFFLKDWNFYETKYLHEIFTKKIKIFLLVMEKIETLWIPFAWNFHIKWNLFC